MGIDDVLDLVQVSSEQGARGSGEPAPRSVKEVGERYNLRAKAEWSNLPRKVRGGVAMALADQWDGSIPGKDQEAANAARAIRDHFRRYAEDPD